MSMIADVRSSPFATRASTRSLKTCKASATAVLSTIIADAQLASEPTARNSKRLPVKAKGDVRLRSVLSISNSGISGISICKPVFPVRLKIFSLSAFSICSRRSLICFPRKEEMIAGGASLAPRRWSLVALITDAFRSPLCL